MSIRINRARFLLVIALPLLLLGACGQGGPSAAAAAPAASEIRPAAAAPLVNVDGQAAGEVTLHTRDGKTVVEVNARGLTPGFHGFHVHAVGKCEPPFTSAGGHAKADGQTHPAHTGDQPVLLANVDGSAQGSFTTDRYAVADLLDADGSALIVHADPDNYANIPLRYAAAPDMTTTATGDAGKRAACGVVKGS